MNIVSRTDNPLEIDFREGAVILVDKPKNWTSFDVVNKIRFSLKSYYGIKKIKVGHNGTLDPLATGLLMIFTGKYTKRIPQEENHDKRYDGIIKMGCTTISLDRETEEEDFKSTDGIGESQIKEAMHTFIGTSDQEIPIFSATKVKGRPMYALARKGEPVSKKSKTVVFHEISLTGFNSPYIHFDLLCGKGTYVRAFARDLGLKLNTSAYLYELRRTAIANNKLENAFDIHTFCNYFLKEDSHEHKS